MGILVKICGINSVEAADAAARAGADFAGLVCHGASPRNLTLDAARMLAERLRGKVRLVALTANAGDEELASIVRAVRPDFIQLHGSETPERAGQVRTRFDIPVIKAVAIAEAGHFANVANFEAVADMLLFDAKPPASATRPGGHGAAFDWQLLRGRKFARPWLLAGGLAPDNVARAIESSSAPGVDVSSGVETQPGVKNAEMIAVFVAAARSAQFSQARA